MFEILCAIECTCTCVSEIMECVCAQDFEGCVDTVEYCGPVGVQDFFLKSATLDSIASSHFCD